MADGNETGRAGKESREDVIARLEEAGVQDNVNLNFLKEAVRLTPTDLALIAANIGTGLDNPDLLAQRALKLWQACAQAVVDQPATRLAHICARLPQPRFPVTLERFLESMMPDSNPETRMSTFQRFLKDHYRLKSDIEVERQRGGWEAPISKTGYFLYMMRAFYFTEWLETDQQMQEWVLDELQSVPKSERAGVRAYLEQQAAEARRERCDNSNRQWNQFENEVTPIDTSAVARQAKVSQMPAHGARGNNKR